MPKAYIPGRPEKFKIPEVRAPHWQIQIHFEGEKFRRKGKSGSARA